MKIAICAATFRRPEMLSELLAGIQLLRFDEFATLSTIVVVVDNDASGSGRVAIERARESFPFDLRYVIEPNRGIAHARNRAVTEALDAGADLVAIIDDDEVPRTEWLVELLRTRERYRADVVYGPVVPKFPQDTPAWVIRGNFFARRPAPTGSLLKTAATHNVLLSRKALTMWAPPFDPQFGLAGVDDTHFFGRLRRAGIPIVSAAEAIVDETIPPARMTLRFLVRRAYNAGAGYVACQRALETRSSWKVKRLAVAVLRTTAGACLTVPSLLLGRHRLAAALAMCALGLGMVAGLVGRRSDRYRRIEGT